MPRFHPLRAMLRWVRFHRNRRILARLDDRTLHDIGLSRSEISHVAWHGRR